MSVYFEIYQTVIQSTSMADLSFDFTEGSFLLLNGQKHLMSVAEDLTSNKQKRTKRIYQKQVRKNSQANISQQVITLSDLCSACENKYHVMETSSVIAVLKDPHSLTL